ncbi:unnamed protein product [Rhizopus stolonifer]
MRKNYEEATNPIEGTSAKDQPMPRLPGIESILGYPCFRQTKHTIHRIKDPHQALVYGRLVPVMTPIPLVYHPYLIKRKESYPAYSQKIVKGRIEKKKLIKIKFHCVHQQNDNTLEKETCQEPSKAP